MRRTCMLTALLLAAVLAVGGCQPTPDRDIVVNKGEGTLQDAIMATPVPTNPPKTAAPEEGAPIDAPAETPLPFDPVYAAPERYEGEFSQGRFSLTYDADVIVPPEQAYPVYRVKNRELTQTFCEGLVDALIGDVPLVDAHKPATKEELTKQMFESIVAWNEGGYDWEEGIESEEDLRKYFEDKIAAAPETVEEDVEIDRKALAGGAYIQADRDGNGIYDCVLNIYETAYGINVSYGRINELTGKRIRVDRLTAPLTIPREEAQPMAEEVVARMGFTDFALLDYEQPIGVDGKPFPAHTFVFGRMVGNTPNIFAASGMGGCDADGREIDSIAKWDIERMEVIINDEGIINIHAFGLTERTDTLNENVALLPFEEIMVRADAQLYASNKDMIENPGNSYTHETVKSIKLMYVRIREKDSKVKGTILIPVWCFYYTTQRGYVEGDGGIVWGEVDEAAMDGSYLPRLMVNAIDGSIVDTLQGY